MAKSEKQAWVDIEKQFGKKRQLGLKISFIKDKFKRKVIFRDIAHAFICYEDGCYKPAVILAGGVIEELIRCYLQKNNITPQKKDFFNYIEACRKNGLLKDSISNLINVVRDFRNSVHIKNEESERFSISKATASGTISHIFTVANDFKSTVKLPENKNVKLLDHENWGVRRSAVNTLGKLFAKEALPALKKQLEKEQHREVRSAIEKAIKKIESEK